MGYKATNNFTDAEFLPDDDSEEAPRSNGHEADMSSEIDESPETNDSDQDHDDDLPPLPPLGLPPNADPNHIPKFSELRRAADRRLDWETAFILLHRDDPHEIAERLDEMADMIRAAISVQGPPGNPERAASLRKAIRLGLALELRYWLRANKFEAWLGLIVPLLTTAIQMEEFQADVFRTWSIYHYIDGAYARAKTAIETSQEFAAESGREDLKLLAQAYQFN
ncbi:MAG: hypothetical protein JXA10_18520, partial [Anaerolineae bacterium]|nr:hypothetical protein [Anaerolineae bacterium]